jgi:hypothetical protein
MHFGKRFVSLALRAFGLVRLRLLQCKRHAVYDCCAKPSLVQSDGTTEPSKNRVGRFVVRLRLGRTPSICLTL